MNYIVTRKAPFGIIGEETYSDFESAKMGFRNAIKQNVGSGITDFTDMINHYSKEYYSDNIPKEFKLLTEFLKRVATDPTFPKNENDIVFEDFEDDNIEFYSPFPSQVYIYVNNPELGVKFPQAEINLPIGEADPNEEYYWYLSDNDCFISDVSLALVED